MASSTTGSSGCANVVHGDFEARRFAGQMLGAVLFRERHVDGFCVTGFDADELVLETGNELAGAQNKLETFCRTALERLAIDLADEIDGELIFVLGLALHIRIGAVGRRDLLQAFIDHRIVHVDDRAFDGDAGKILHFEIGNDLIGNGDLQIALAGDDILSFALVLGQREFRLAGRLFLTLGNGGVGGFVQRVV